MRKCGAMSVFCRRMLDGTVNSWWRRPLVCWWPTALAEQRKHKYVPEVQDFDILLISRVCEGARERSPHKSDSDTSELEELQAKSPFHSRVPGKDVFPCKTSGGAGRESKTRCLRSAITQNAQSERHTGRPAGRWSSVANTKFTAWWTSATRTEAGAHTAGAPRFRRTAKLETLRRSSALNTPRATW